VARDTRLASHLDAITASILLTENTNCRKSLDGMSNLRIGGSLATNGDGHGNGGSRVTSTLLHASRHSLDGRRVQSVSHGIEMEDTAR